MRTRSLAVISLILAVVSVSAAGWQNRARPPLSSADVDAIATLLKLEDTRTLDEAALAPILKSAHPEVRRRAVQTVARINDPRGRALVVAARGDADVEVAATVAFATGQLKDADSVSWLGTLLDAKDTPSPVAREAARALGKIRSPEARVALARYLTSASATAATTPVVGEALLSIGRFTTREDLAPIVRWITSPNVEIRWRATWALYRPRDPAAIPHLLRLTEDASPDVRFWAMRGLTPPAANARAGAPGAAVATPVPADWAAIDRAKTSARLREGLRDGDRRVRTEALRALAQYDDDEAFGAVLAALESPDTWLSVSAAENLGRFPAHAAAIVPKLIAAAKPDRPTALRITALTPLVTLAPDAALDAAVALVRDRSQVARNAAAQALQRLGAPGTAKLAELAADPTMQGLLPPPRGQRGGSPAGVAPAGAGAQAGGQRPARVARPDAEYRQLVEQWIVPDYKGAPKPRAVWDTPKGQIEIELYPGEAPFGVEYFVKMVESGKIVGTEFGRVVPNFVDQQSAIRDTTGTLRDEISRLGLTRGNLSWASAGLDTGRPGYTLGSTPQPHNEGDFTALGRVIRGMDVVDRIELGDAVTGARILK